MTAIVDIYMRTRKSRDQPWNTYVCRPLAAVFVHFLAPTRATPNQITLLSFVVALFSCLLLMGAQGLAGLWLAILIYELSYVLDCVDGMLARLRGVQSQQGHLLDFLMDELKAFLVLAAACVGWYHRGDGVAPLLWGIGGLVCLASGIAMTTFLRRPEIAGAPVDTAPAPAISAAPGWLGWVESAGKFLIHYPSYIWIAALLGRIELYVYPYVAANVAYALRAWLGIARRFGRQ